MLPAHVVNPSTNPNPSVPRLSMNPDAGVIPASPAIPPLATATTPGGNPCPVREAATIHVSAETQPPICVEATVEVARLPVLRAEPALNPNQPESRSVEWSVS